MKTNRPTGLGDPVFKGKLSLFLPPDSSSRGLSAATGPEGAPGPAEGQEKRVRTTLDLTWTALQVVQDLQQQHRLKTGRALPLWKAASMAIEGFAQAKAKKD